MQCVRLLSTKSNNNNLNNVVMFKKVTSYTLRRSLCSQIDDLAPAYQPKEVEKSVLENAREDYFKSAIKSSKPFTLILPPPNITGTLHLGHALTTTIQDVLVRWNKMHGRETMWVPGMDHAGIATQVVVEKKLWKEKGLTRHDVGRTAFEDEVWKWKGEKADVIRQQLRRLGASLDWRKEMFTMDVGQSRAVTEAFVKLHENGLIYRSDYLVNWSCVLQSAISDIEVEHLQVEGPTAVPVPGYPEPVQFGVLTKFAYKLHNSDEEIIVATTRPETIFGDVAVAVNPGDDRYSSFIGRNLWHPFRNETIPIICDNFVDVGFGTGAVKITPGHDPVDLAAAKRHHLPVLKVIDEGGALTSCCGEYAGIPRFKARTAVVNSLQELGLFRGSAGHQMAVPMCSRSKDVVEFLVKPQWFLSCKEMAFRAVEDVRSGALTVSPANFEKIWFNWLENIRDWCISRQLWWGHRVPAYECSHGEKKYWIAARNQQEASVKAAERFPGISPDDISIKQDEDVLDTWFSSAILPFSAFGWPEKTSELDKYYPLSLMETGHDILFFWVARMVMLGKELTGQLPFSKIMLHGIVCDAYGRKMSKSLGNVVAPEDVINGISLKDMDKNLRLNHAAGLLSDAELEKALIGQRKMFPEGIPECGSDALRFTLCSHNVKCHNINFDVRECHTNRLFCNKIWQAAKFVKLWTDKLKEAGNLNTVDTKVLLSMDKWILSRLAYTVDAVDSHIEEFDFNMATSALKYFLYYNFCDVYLETTKRDLRSVEGIAAAGHCWTLLFCLDVGLRALAPFMPKLSQHIHQRLPEFPGINKSYDFPERLPFRNEVLEKDVDNVLEVCVGIRRLKKIFSISAKHKPEVNIVSSQPTYKEFATEIQDLAKCYTVSVSNSPLVLEENTVSDTIRGAVKIYLIIPEDVKKSFSVDLPKYEQKMQKLQTELEKIKSAVSADKYKIRVSLENQHLDEKKILDLEEKISRINYITSLCKR